MVDASGSRAARVLAIGAHPDDVEFGCGATLLKHRSGGAAVAILTLSRGERGGQTAEREREARAAADLIGARLTLLDFPDCGIIDGVETIAAIEAVIAEIRPTHVYTHSMHDTHQDHRAVHAATRVAARSVPTLACYEAPSTTSEFKPVVYVDIADFMDGKAALIDTFASQAARRDIYHAEYAVAAARYWGRHAGRAFAEPFELVRQIDFA